MKILAIIPARGGSKSIPKKNIYPVLGKSLIAYTFEAVKKSKLVDRTILTTDSEEIAAVAKKYGIEVPFLRPSELATDTASDLPVFQHALTLLKEHDGYVPDIIVQLRPTSPLKCGRDIDAATQLLIDNPKADSVRSVRRPAQTPFKMFTKDETTGLLQPLLPKSFPEIFKKFNGQPYDMPRQVLPVVWEYSAYIDVLRYDTIMKRHSMSGKNIVPFMYEELRDIDIDSMRELQYAELIMKEMEKKKTPLNP